MSSTRPGASRASTATPRKRPIASGLRDDEQRVRAVNDEAERSQNQCRRPPSTPEAKEGDRDVLAVEAGRYSFSAPVGPAGSR
jgi:hypothetical protein